MWCSNWLRLVWPWENAAIVREDAKVVHLLFASCHFCTSNVCAHCRGRVFSKEPFFEPFPQILQPLRLRRGDCDDLHTGKTFSKGVEIFLGARQVHFVSNNAPGPLGKSRIVEVDLASKILQILDRMPAFAASDIENEKQNPATCDVPKKVVAESDISVRAFDESRNVCDRSATITVELDHADDGMKRGERIGRYLRMRRGDFAEQSRLARIRITDERRVRHRSQFKYEMALL